MKSWTLFVAALLLACAPCLAEEKPAPKKPDTEPAKPAKEGKAAAQGDLAQILAKLDKTNRAMKTLEVPYLQRRKVRISRRIRKSWGIFRLEKRPKPKGMRILFEETKPHRLKLLFTDTRVVYHDMTSGKVDERDPRQGGVRPSELWVVGRPMESVKKSYTIALAKLSKEEAKLYSARLLLKPRDKKIQKWVKEMHIWLGKKSAVPLRVKLVDPRKEWQEFIFDPAKLKMNTKLDPKLFVVGG